VLTYYVIFHRLCGDDPGAVARGEFTIRPGAAGNRENRFRAEALGFRTVFI